MRQLLVERLRDHRSHLEECQPGEDHRGIEMADQDTAGRSRYAGERRTLRSAPQVFLIEVVGEESEFSFVRSCTLAMMVDEESRCSYALSGDVKRSCRLLLSLPNLPIGLQTRRILELLESVRTVYLLVQG